MTPEIIEISPSYALNIFYAAPIANASEIKNWLFGFLESEFKRLDCKAELIDGTTYDKDLAGLYDLKAIMVFINNASDLMKAKLGLDLPALERELKRQKCLIGGGELAWEETPKWKPAG